ncbi:MAG TPA: MFS transporter [Gaiellaceae bacterium]|nr:MFS transporter [Gaiellaceae bacterium]
MRNYLRGLNPNLSRSTWVLLSGSFANALGNGVVFPFLLIYLHNVRGIPLGTAGIVLAVTSVAGLVAGPLAGTLIDAIGPRWVLVGSMIVSAAGFGGFALVHSVGSALVVAALAGLGNGSFWPSHATMVAALTERESRHNAYAMQRVLNNLGIGVGGVVGGLIASTAHPRTYELLFAIDAVTFAGYLVALAFVPSPGRGHAIAQRVRGGYTRVLRHKTFVAYIVLNAALVAVGFSLLGDIFPAFAKNTAHVSEKGIGLCFLANTLVIVVAQLPVAKWLEGKRRMPAYTIEGTVWAVAWLIVFAGGWWLDGPAAGVVFALALTVFGFGECFHGTVQNALIADLAKPDLLGRYLALNGFGFQLGGAAGRAAGGFALALAPHALWLVAAAVAFGVGLSALAYERVLPEHVRRTPVTVGPEAA